MHIREATQSYETFLSLYVQLDEADLRRKHRLMADDLFCFLRGTFYRWIVRFAEICPDNTAAPRILGAGDVHAENFGTWRDDEGRLVWGLNDFDEASRYPFASELIRLATSLIIAIDENHLSVDARKACAALLKGYQDQLVAKSPEPFVLEEEHPHLRSLAIAAAHRPQTFWAKLRQAPHAEPPARVKELATRHLPRGSRNLRYVHRTAGIGSLGLPRFAAIAHGGGGLVAREVRARVPAAKAWAGLDEHDPYLYGEILARAVRAPDPFVDVRRNWLVRRLAPHCERLELADLRRARDLERVMEAMGAETANIHRATRKAVPRILGNLTQQDGSWLHDAGARMADDVRADWQAWRRHASGK